MEIVQKKSALIWLWLSVIIVAIDQAIKYFVSLTLTLNQPKVLLPFLNATLSYNPGAAFSFFGDSGGWQIIFLSLISIIVSLILIGWLFRLPRSSKFLPLALSLIIGGAVGNLIDRLRFGYVVDYIDFHINNWHFAIFNFADSAITVGTILLIINLLFSKKGE